jgi:hypothetical protein
MSSVILYSFCCHLIEHPPFRSEESEDKNFLVWLFQEAMIISDKAKIRSFFFDIQIDTPYSWWIILDKLQIPVAISFNIIDMFILIQSILIMQMNLSPSNIIHIQYAILINVTYLTFKFTKYFRQHDKPLRLGRTVKELGRRQCSEKLFYNANILHQAFL